MKRQSLVLIAVAIAGAGAAGCFKDPVSSLRNGPSVMSVSNSAVYLRTGDSVTVTATLLDHAGNQLPLSDSATWTSSDPSIATARNDNSLVIPGNAYSRGVIVAVDSATGGWTNVIVAARGVADTIRVVVSPAKLTAQHVAFAGPTLTDTVLVPSISLPPTPAKVTPYSAPDTLVLTGTSLLTFDTSAVTVSVATSNGASKGLVVYKSPDTLKVIFETGAAGKVMVQHLLLTPGNASVGTVNVDTLISDSVEVAPWRLGLAAFGGSATQAGDTLTVTAGTGMAFDTSLIGGTTVQSRDSLWLPKTFVTFTPPLDSAGFSDTAYIISKTPTTYRVLAPTTRAAFRVTVRHVAMAASASVDSVTFDSIKTNNGPRSIAQASLPNADVAVVGDTMTVTVPASLVAFDTSTAAGDTLADGTAFRTSVSLDTTAALITANTPSTMAVVSPVTYTGKVTLLNATVGLTRIPKLTTPAATFTIAKASFPNANVAQSGDTLTITAPPAVTFVPTGAQATGAAFGTHTAIIISKTASTLSYVLSPLDYAGPVTVTNAKIGLATVPKLTTAASYTLSAFALPAGNVTLGGGNLGDTVTVTAPSGLTFTTSGSVSKVLLGNTAINTSDTAWTLSRTSTTIKAFAKRGGTGPVTVTNLNLGSLVVPTLGTVASQTIDSVVSDLPSGPTEGSALAATIPASGVDTVYGWVNVKSAPQDFWTFTTTATDTISATLGWFGTGNPGYGGAGNSDVAHTADLDMLLCNAGLACDESVADLFGYGGATASQPEVGTSGALPAAQYWITAIAFTAGSESVVYRLIISVK